MHLLRSFIGVAICAVAVMQLTACSPNEETAGIEIGNPSIAEKDTLAVSLTADFSVDYSEVLKSFKKEAALDEPVVLDTFSLDLIGVRTYSSYYVAVSIDPTEGLLVWPSETASETILPISFTEGSSVEGPFENINLQDEGYLKEIGVSFKTSNEKPVLAGKVLLNGSYVPFKYSLTAFQQATLRYHFTQVEQVNQNLVNLSVVFYVRDFVNGIDFSSAVIDEDGVIYLDQSHNISLWSQLNLNFLASFRPLRYDYLDYHGNESSDYVSSIWEDVVGKMEMNNISNGDFSAGSKGWILFNQFGGASDSSFIADKNENIMKIEVTRGGSQSYSVQLIQEDLALVKGIRYKCVFTIWSDIEGDITARIGSYDDYETIGFQEHVNVSTGGKSVEIEFTPAESTPFARFELNLGGLERTFYIKAIKIYRLENF